MLTMLGMTAVCEGLLTSDKDKKYLQPPSVTWREKILEKKIAFSHFVINIGKSDKDFAHLVSAFFNGTRGKNVNHFNPNQQETARAARKFFALALANDLVKPYGESSVAQVVTELTSKEVEKEDLRYFARLGFHFKIEYVPGLYQKYTTHLSSGENPIRAMSLAMEEVKRGNPLEATNETEEKNSLKTLNAPLGCGFKNDEFLYPRSKTGIATKSIWAREDAVFPIKFTTDRELLEFLEDLKSLCANVIGSTRYNDIDQLIW